MKNSMTALILFLICSINTFSMIYSSEQSLRRERLRHRQIPQYINDPYSNVDKNPENYIILGKENQVQRQTSKTNAPNMAYYPIINNKNIEEEKHKRLRPFKKGIRGNNAYYGNYEAYNSLLRKEGLKRTPIKLVKDVYATTIPSDADIGKYEAQISNIDRIIDPQKTKYYYNPAIVDLKNLKRRIEKYISQIKELKSRTDLPAVVYERKKFGLADQQNLINAQLEELNKRYNI